MSSFFAHSISIAFSFYQYVDFSTLSTCDIPEFVFYIQMQCVEGDTDDMETLLSLSLTLTPWFICKLNRTYTFFSELAG